MALAGVRNGQALAALRAAALEHQPAFLGRHPHEKPVRLFPVPPVRLKCADAFRHDLKTSAAQLAEWRNIDSSERLARVSIVRRKTAMLSCVSRDTRGGVRPFA